MATNHSFLLSFKKLSILLLPTALRSSLMISFVRVSMNPISTLHATLVKYRTDKNYRLTHNGQVCYLQAVLNDRFDPLTGTGRRIVIAEAEAKEPSFVYWRVEEQLVGIPTRVNGSFIISRRGYSGTTGFDFVVKVPADIYTDTTLRQQIRAVTNEYKLASKQFDITNK